MVALRDADPVNRRGTVDIYLGEREANERAVRSYQKIGFQVDGRLRQAFHRDGEWHDELLMCVLRDELT